MKKVSMVLCLMAGLLISGYGASRAQQGDSTMGQALPRPDAKPADLTKPVKVFILLGQSNMLGMGEVGPEATQGTLEYVTRTQKKYPHLLDEAGQWASYIPDA